MSKASGCSYQALAREFVASLSWDPAFFENSNDRCYCSRCYKEAWNDFIPAGDSKYVIPRGWVRLGLVVDPVTAKAHDIWNKWIVTYHGTSKIAAKSIIAHRQFCMPGDTLIDGTKLAIRPGHIPDQNFIYTSPTIAYSSGPVYSPVYNFHSEENGSNYEAQIVLHCRQMPKTFKVGPETIGAKGQICPHIPNSEIEYYTDRRATLVAYGLLVRFRPKNG
jgi:neuralized-like protein 4